MLTGSWSAKCVRVSKHRSHHLVASIIDTVVNLAKRRGLVYPAGEIYGGTKSAWDYGPLGVELKENIKRQWWRSVVTGRDDVVGLDSSIILPREVWVASGHVEVFNDPLVESSDHCHKRYRQDHHHRGLRSSRRAVNRTTCR
jgi:glycyl-tRNA synthetase